MFDERKNKGGMKMLKRKMGAWACSLGIVLLCVACEDGGGQEIKEVAEDGTVVVSEKSVFEKNEQEFFEIAYGMNQLIEQSNNYFGEGEHLLKNGPWEKYEQFQPNAAERMNVFLEGVEDMKARIDGMTKSDNEAYNDGLALVQEKLLEGVQEYMAVASFYEEHFLPAFKAKDEAEYTSLSKEFAAVSEKYKIQLGGNITQMHDAFMNANILFVTDVGKFEDGYTKDTFVNNIGAYFEERLPTQ